MAHDEPGVSLVAGVSLSAWRNGQPLSTGLPLMVQLDVEQRMELLCCRHRDRKFMPIGSVRSLRRLNLPCRPGKNVRETCGAACPGGSMAATGTALTELPLRRLPEPSLASDQHR